MHTINPRVNFLKEVRKTIFSDEEVRFIKDHKKELKRIILISTFLKLCTKGIAKPKIIKKP
ncbi:hypothetical protein EBR43_08425 [bacterium]|nr:hypothetical protein [bacterium]